MNDIRFPGLPGGANTASDTHTASDTGAVDLRFVTRAVSAEEAAAVTAVVLAAVDEHRPAASVAEPLRDPWVQSAHALRTPLAVGPGAWARSAR